MKIKISTDFSDTPGARYYEDGEFSGQEFYEKILRDKFSACKEQGTTLEVDLDDCYGFASSFLSESFGKLSEHFGKDDTLRIIKIISLHDPLLPQQIIDIIENPKGSRRKHEQ